MHGLPQRVVEQMVSHYVGERERVVAAMTTEKVLECCLVFFGMKSYMLHIDESSSSR